MSMIQEAAARFCRSFVNCDGCPFNKNPEDGCAILSIASSKQDPEIMISTVLQWAKEHPEDDRETYADVIFKMFPNARYAPIITRNGVIGKRPLACRETLFYTGNACCNDCARCWTTPIPEAMRKTIKE